MTYELKQNYNLVLNRYLVDPNAELLGQGSFSIVQLGYDTWNNNAPVAVKTYKNMQGVDGRKAVVSDEKVKEMIKRFCRQIRVLQVLGAEWSEADVAATRNGPTQGYWKSTTDSNGVASSMAGGIQSNTRLHNASLMKMKPENAFLKLVDFSKDASGKPGLDATDNTMYVVTEVADYSLKEYLSEFKNAHTHISLSAAKNVAKSVITIVAMLHAKGFAHLDIKPENIMRAGNHWKLIDVDGCLELDTQIVLGDSSVSFSPVYCSPEWGQFMIAKGDVQKPQTGAADWKTTLQIRNTMDVWSVGISLLELAAMHPLFKPKFQAFYKVASSQKQATCLFLDWLCNRKNELGLNDILGLKNNQTCLFETGPFRSYGEAQNFMRSASNDASLFCDDGFMDLIMNHMLVKDPTQRMTAAECLSHPLFEDTPDIPAVVEQKIAQEAWQPVARSSLSQAERTPVFSS